MVQTPSNNTPPEGGSNLDSMEAQLTAIASRLDSFESLKDDVVTLKSQNNPKWNPHIRFNRFDDGGESSWRVRQPYRTYNKIEFPFF